MLLGHLEKCGELAAQEEDAQVQQQFKKLIKALVTQEKETLAMMEHKRPVEESLVFAPQTLEEFQGAQKSAEKADRMVKVIDYIANPAVLKKSYDVTASLQSDLNEIITAEPLFKAVLEKV